MDLAEISRRLAAQEGLLHLIVQVLAPEPAESEGTGYDDLIETLVDLTEAVSDLAVAVRALPCGGCNSPAPARGSPYAGV